MGRLSAKETKRRIGCETNASRARRRIPGGITSYIRREDSVSQLPEAHNGFYSSQLVRLQSTGDVARPEGLGEAVPGAAPFVSVTVLLEEFELLGPRVHFPRIKPALSGYFTASHGRASSKPRVPNWRPRPWREQGACQRGAWATPRGRAPRSGVLPAGLDEFWRGSMRYLWGDGAARTMAGAGQRSVERVGDKTALFLGGKPSPGRSDGDGSPEAQPVLGYILKGYPRISETFISNEILLLEQLGFSLSVFSMRQPRESFTHRSVAEIKARAAYLPETLILHLPRLLCHNALLAGSRPDGYRRAFRVMVRRLRRSRTIATFRHLLQAGYLVHALLPGTGVRHLHAHFAHSPTSVAFFASQLSGLPFSFTAHAKDIYISDPAQLREKAQFARFIVTCTERNRQYLTELAPPTTPIHCIYHGINVELFTGPATQAQPRPPFRILTVARLVEKKGLPTVFRALRLLLDQGHLISYCLIGDGEDRQPTLDLLERLGVGQVTEWLGTQPHEVVLDEYRKADLFVLGCQVARDGDRDGLPNVFLESMAMGVPVVATKVWAIPELVEDGRSGLLVPPEDPGAMAAAMVHLLTDMSLRRRVIAGAHDRVRNDFDNRRLIGKLGALFDGVGVKRESPHARADT